MIYLSMIYQLIIEKNGSFVVQKRYGLLDAAACDLGREWNATVVVSSMVAAAKRTDGDKKTIKKQRKKLRIRRRRSESSIVV